MIEQQPDASGSATSKPLVEVVNLRMRYGSFVAVDDISFSIPRGEVFGFIGPNGAGKTTTIKVLATLLRPSGGHASVCGYDVVRAPQLVRPRIGYVPDSFGVYEDLTSMQYLHFFAAAYGVPRQKRQDIIDNLLRLTDLTEKANEQVDSLSRGMKQRLSLARVLVHDPDVLLLDEPASGLDPRARIEVREFLRELTRMGKTILISSHILPELAQLCTRIGIIEAGRMVAQGTLSEIQKRLELDRSVHIQLANGDAAMLERIRAIPGVTHVVQEVDRIAVRLSEHQLSFEDLLDHIHALGARIRMFQPEALDMETLFLKLTEGKTQ
ncbi:MAG: ABC transporter ATP-binding protein [Planctomycetota bacterium]